MARGDRLPQKILPESLPERLPEPLPARLPRIRLLLIVFGLGALALVPQWPGFWVLPSFFGWAGLLVWGPANIRRLLASLLVPPRRRPAAAALKVAVVVAALLAVGSWRRAPMWNLAGPSGASLPQATVEFLRKLEAPVHMEAALSSPARERPARFVLGLYERASPLVTTSVVQAGRQAVVGGGALTLAVPDTVTITSEGFEEAVSPVTVPAIDAALRRLGAPNRLVLALTGDGEKSAFDTSPMGLSLWAESLQNSKIHLKDCLWDGAGLPPEAWAAHALVLAGPRRPLGEEREAALMDYLARGGKLLILQDPMVAGFHPGALARWGLSMPWGLAVDPGASWAATEDFFLVARDFPAHPMTVGLTQPVVWPLAGALAAVPPSGGEDGPGGNGSAPDGHAPAGRDTGGPDSGGQAPGGQPPGESAQDESATGGPEDSWAAAEAAGGVPASHTWAVALSSDAAWLETDRGSLADRSHRYQPGSDLPGPLVLASATTIEGGGRLVVAADADLAANAFIGYAGNLALLDNMIFWLVGAQEDLAAPPPTAWLDITHAKARTLFWIPTAIWPLAALWFWYRRHRARRAGAS